MRKFIQILFLFCFYGYSYGQTNTSTNKQAQKIYEQASSSIATKSYEKAIEQLSQAVAIDQNFTVAYQQLGDIYRRLQNYQEAKKNYQKVLSINPEFNSLTYFGIAESELNTGDYENALKHFKKYSQYTTINQTSKKLAAKYIADCEFSLNAIKNPVSFNPVNLGEGVNSKELEYLPAITADDGILIFTRQTNKNEDFYLSRNSDNKWNNAVGLSNVINTTTFNEGSQSISPDGAYIFFTGCNRPDGMGRCDIYVSRKEGKEWSKPFNIGPPVNGPGWESQPSLSADGRTMYFVSTRPGGIGGYDIWKSELKEGGEWSAPENLGPTINTEYDEISPFIHPDGETLYFSSNGWPGLGNKDMFVSRKIKNADGKTTWQKPENLGYPINSFKEESSLTVSNDGRKAYFSSDKEGGFGGLDIYSFALADKLRPQPVTYVKGIIFDAETKDPLEAKIKVINLADSKPTFDDISDYETGEFLATMPLGKIFALNVEKDGYLFYSENFSLNKNKTLMNDSSFHIKIPLQKISLGSKVVMKNIFFDTNKYDLLPESKTELDQLVAFLKTNSKVGIEISGHTDNVGDDKLNMMLSENRAKTVYGYLISNKIDPSRLVYKGYGETTPVKDNSSEEGRQQNRRTEFKIIKN